MKKVILLMLALSLALVLADCDSDENGENDCANPTFPNPINISGTTASSQFNFAAMDSAGNLYVVWMEDIDPSGGYDYRLLFAKSDNYGSTWTEPKIIGGDFFRDPRITVDKNGYLYITGYGFDYSSLNYEIYLISSIDEGVTWSEQNNISHTKSDSGESSIVIDSNGKIYVAWSEYKEQSYDIYVIYSDDSGHSWSNIQNVSKTPGHSRYPFLYIDSIDNVCLIWKDHVASESSRPRLFFSRSTDGGINWMEPVNVFDNSSEAGDLSFDSNNNIYITSNADTNGQIDICLKKSTDGGKSWGESINISNSACKSEHPKIAIDYLGNISVVWVENQSSRYSYLFFNHSCNNGDSWNQPMQIINSGGAWNPNILVDDKTYLYLFWAHWDIYFTSTKKD
jgi:hypothetical protein